MSSESRLERRLDALLSHASRNSIRAWLSIWGVLVLLGFRCPLALATRALLAGAAAISFWRGHPIAGGIVLAFFLTYLLQVPLILGVAFGERELRRDRSQA